MRKFYIDLEEETILVLENGNIKEFTLTLTEEDDEEEEAEEEEVKPVKAAAKKKRSGVTIMHVTADNWQKFELLGNDVVRAMDADERKEYKKQYAKYWYWKNKGSVKKEDTPKTTEPKPERNTGDALVETVAASEPKEKELPMDLINRFGRTPVEVVYMEKNRGIGYTADEIFEQKDARLKIFSLSEIEEIVEGLEAVGM